MAGKRNRKQPQTTHNQRNPAPHTMERVEMKPPKLSREEREREAEFLKNASGEDLQKLFRQAQQTKGKELNMTEDEAKRIDDAFEKPEFMDLFREYVDDISDPKNMEEYDQYLRQLEEEGEIPADEEVVRPEKGFVVKTKAVDTGAKIFINCVGTDKVPAPTQNSTPSEGIRAEDTTGSKGKGSYWSIPYIHTSVRMDRDKSDQPCHVYDILYNTETIRLSEKHAAFKGLVIQTALESLEENAKTKLKDPATNKYDYSIMKQMRYKGNTVRPHKLKKDQTQQPTVQKNKANNTAPVPKPKPQAPKAEAPPPEPDGPIAPKVSLVHRGEIALSDSITSLGSVNQPLSRRPKELVVRLELPLLTSGISDMQLDIKGGYLEFSCSGVYELKYKLPYPVDDTSGDAKYSKTQKILTVTLAVLPWTEPEVQAEQQKLKQQEEEEARRREEEARRREEEEEKRRKQEEEDAARVVKKGFLSGSKAPAGSRPASDTSKSDDTAAVQIEEHLAAADGSEAEQVAVAKPMIQDLGNYKEGTTKTGKSSEESKAEEGEAEVEEEEGEAEKPPMSFRQNQQNVTVVVRVEGVRASSVKVEFKKRSVTLAFSAQGKRYASDVYMGGRVDVKACRYDVSDVNMVLVLRKWTPGRWTAITVSELVEDESEDEAEKEEEKQTKAGESAAPAQESSREEVAKRAGGEEEKQDDEGKGGRKKAVRWSQKLEEAEAGADTTGGAGGGGGGGAGGGSDGEFEPAMHFKGAKPGFVFKQGQQGLGYYKDSLEGLRVATSSSGGSNSAVAPPEEPPQREQEKGTSVADRQAELAKAVMSPGNKLPAMPKMAFTNNLAFDLD